MMIARFTQHLRFWLCLAVVLSTMGPATASAETFVIAASPSVKAPLEMLARTFESMHPDVLVHLSIERGLDLRWTIAQLENKGSIVVEHGPVHLVAPGGDELVTRLAQKQYIIPETRTLYATRPLVLIVPESLVDAPTSFESIAEDTRWRVAVADPAITPLGQETAACLKSLGIAQASAGRFDVALDARAVLDHVLRGEADVGILFGPDAVAERERIRVAAIAPERHHRPHIYSMAMERSCPNRTRCAEFLSFVRSSTAKEQLRQLGYGIPLSSGHE
jgi:molybdate transport system substrate-binding protein